MTSALASLTDALPLATELAAARSQMAFTLGFHIILASLGVGFPALMLIANYRGLRKNDPDALLLARRWSKVAAVTFAVGAVTGTVLSFEFGLLWPAFTGRFGEVFGILFAIEGIFFFLEAIFIAIYIFGWKHLSGWTHFWTGVPIVITGLGGAFAVVAVNSWMNQPQGFTLTSGEVTNVEPLKVTFNPAVAYEVPHMILAAYLVSGFLVASVYAVGMLRGRRDHYHRLGLLIPLTVACIVTPVQFAVGDTAARSIAKDQPVKFAAMECVQKTATHVPEYLGGRCTSDGVKGGIEIPGLNSFLVGVAGAVGLAGILVLRADARYLYDGLTSEGLPLVILSALCGSAVLVLLRRGVPRSARPLAVRAVVAVVWGWGVAQYPYLLPETLEIQQGAAASATSTSVLIVFGVAVVLVLPAIALLFRLTQRGLIEESESPQPLGTTGG